MADSIQTAIGNRAILATDTNFLFGELGRDTDHGRLNAGSVVNSTLRTFESNYFFPATTAFSGAVPTQTTNIAPIWGYSCHRLKVNVSAGSGAHADNLMIQSYFTGADGIAVVNPLHGDRFIIQVSMPASLNPTFKIYNVDSEANETELTTVTSAAVAHVWLVELIYDENLAHWDLWDIRQQQ
jgi:hypothetical protein